MGSNSECYRRFVAVNIVCFFFLTSVAWTQEASPPKPHQTGQHVVQFSQRDARSSPAEANRRFGDGVRFNPNAANYDIGSESFDVYVPDDYDQSERYGLIVWINAQDAGAIPRDYQPLMDKHRLIWIGANNAGNDRSPFWIRAMLAIDGVYNMKSLYNIDPDRVYVCGPSGGGRVSSMVAVTFPDVFTGGGYYVIGCNYMSNLVMEGNKYAPGFWTKPDPRIVAVSKQRRYALITGSEDFNKPGTERVYKGYRDDGFKHVTYLEQPGLGHRLPSAQWYEKGLVALDKPLIDAAPGMFESAATAEKEGKLLDAYKAYVFAATHGRDQDFYEQAKTKSNELKPKMAGLSLTAFEDLGDDPPPKQLRQLARDWSGYPGAQRAYESAALLGDAELSRIEELDRIERRPALQKFLKDWAGYNVYGNAIGVLNKDAMTTLKEIREIKNGRDRARKLRRFADAWAPSPVIGLANLDFGNLATAELDQIKQIPDKRKRYSKLVAFLKEFPETKAHNDAIQILNAMQGR